MKKQENKKTKKRYYIREFSLIWWIIAILSTTAVITLSQIIYTMFWVLIGGWKNELF